MSMSIKKDRLSDFLQCAKDLYGPVVRGNIPPYVVCDCRREVVDDFITRFITSFDRDKGPFFDLTLRQNGIRAVHKANMCLSYSSSISFPNRIEKIRLSLCRYNKHQFIKDFKRNPTPYDAEEVALNPHGTSAVMEENCIWFVHPKLILDLSNTDEDAKCFSMTPFLGVLRAHYSYSTMLGYIFIRVDDVTCCLNELVEDFIRFFRSSTFSVISPENMRTEIGGISLREKMRATQIVSKFKYFYMQEEREKRDAAILSRVVFFICKKLDPSCADLTEIQRMLETGPILLADF